MSTTMLSLAGVAGPGGVAETAESTVSCLYSVLRSVVFVTDYHWNRQRINPPPAACC